MEDKDLKQLVADTGRILLEKGLVARTWGNISARKDATKFAISPSGLGYENMQGDDVPIYDSETGTWEGTRKPSSEKKIHGAAYKLYPNVNFVIHTHQDYATAVGLTDISNLDMSVEERNILGGVAVAGYGLPGTKKLAANVSKALEKAQTILMAHHGALILGADRDEALKKAELLEAVCKRTVLKKVGPDTARAAENLSEDMTAMTRVMTFVSDENILTLAEKGSFKAQLDDMAQMLGSKVRVTEPSQEKILAALNKSDAVFVKGVGCLIKCEKEDDESALAILLKKAAISKRYADACGVKGNLSAFDCVLMRTVYKLKYSKKKDS